MEGGAYEDKNGEIKCGDEICNVEIWWNAFGEILGIFCF
jgi:hypothetical protein